MTSHVLPSVPETPFETIIKDYQEKQDDMMAEQRQRSTIRDEMTNMPAFVGNEYGHDHCDHYQ